MSEAGTPGARGRGRGKSRGGLGKYLRARGRGRGLGRPAEFGTRLLMDGEGQEEDEEAIAEAAERAKKYSRRQLGTNEDRYVEPEAELDSDGKEVVEPEVDLSSFLDRQRLSDSQGPSVLVTSSNVEDEDEVDHTLAHISSRSGANVDGSRKGKVQSIEWDHELDDMNREMASAEAARDLKSRFRTKQASGIGRREQRHSEKRYVEPPPLPGESLPLNKPPKEEMQNFLDDLLG